VVHCPAILEPLVGKVIASPEALEWAAANKLARPAIIPSASPPGGTRRGGTNGGGGIGSGRGARDGDEGVVNQSSAVGSFLRGVLGAAWMAVGYTRGDLSRHASSSASESAAASTPAAPVSATPTSQTQPQHLPPRQVGVMYRVSADDNNDNAEEEQDLRSLPTHQRRPSHRHRASFANRLFCGVFGGESAGGGAHDAETAVGAAAVNHATRPASRILASHGYRIRITPWVISLYCCMFFYNIVICNDAGVATHDENPLVGGSKNSMLGKCAYAHNGEHMVHLGQMWRMFTSPWAHGGLASLAVNILVVSYVVGSRAIMNGLCTARSPASPHCTPLRWSPVCCRTPELVCTVCLPPRSSSTPEPEPPERCEKKKRRSAVTQSLMSLSYLHRDAHLTFHYSARVAPFFTSRELYYLDELCILTTSLLSALLSLQSLKPFIP
jgi:hypothetical protein